jgi:hypothetical protein
MREKWRNNITQISRNRFKDGRLKEPVIVTRQRKSYLITTAGNDLLLPSSLLLSTKTSFAVLSEDFPWKLK